MLKPYPKHITEPTVRPKPPLGRPTNKLVSQALGPCLPVYCWCLLLGLKPNLAGESILRFI